MISDLPHRRHLIDEILTVLAGNLSGLSDDELATLLDAAVNEPSASMAVKAIESPKNSAVVHINPGAGKDDAIGALREITGWLDSHWDEYAAAALANALRFAGSERRDPGLPN